MKQLERSKIPWPVFAVTVAAAFMVALDLSIVNAAFPSIRQLFPQVSTATLSWVLAAYSVVFGALLLGAGRIADRSGRRRIFLLGLLIFTAGSLLCGIAPSAWLLIAGRVVQAIGAALLMPTSLALLLSATAPAARAQAVAMWGGVSALAVATGPSLGSVLIDAGGWRWAFFVNLPVALVAGIAAPHWLPGALLVGVGVALSFPVLSAAAVAGLPQERFGTGGAINQTARQIGAVLGVALLIAIVGTPSSVDQAMHRFRIAWLVGAGAALGSAAISSFHRRPAATKVAVPVVLAPADAA